jgi:hypothetical protein
MKKITITLLCTAALSGIARAQDSAAIAAYRKHMIDSIKKAYRIEAAIRNPSLRMAMVSTSIISTGQLVGKDRQKTLFNSDFNQRRTEGLFNLPVRSWGKNTVKASLALANTHFVISNAKGPGTFTDSTIDKSTVGFTATFSRIDSLFGHMMIYSANVTAFTGDMVTLNKLSLMLSGLMVLKQTKQTSLLAGVIVLVDPTSNIPVIPMMMYTRRLPNNFDLNITLPQQLMLRKTFNRRVWASFGTSLSSSNSFFSYSSPLVPRAANFSTLDLKTGPGVEYRLTNKLIAGISGGLWTPLLYRQAGRWEKTNSWFFNGKADTTPYLNVSLSLLPF